MATKAKNARKTKKDVVTLLEKDHETVRGLLASLEKTTDRSLDRRRELVDRIEREVKAHTTVEEEIVYPAFRAAAKTKEDKTLFFEAHEEHDIADLALRRVKETPVGGETFPARAKVLKDLIEHHAEEEEEEMFPRMKELLEADELESLGERVEARKEQLLGADGHASR